MSRLGIVIDNGSPTCKHQALASLCGYEYCMNCSYKFFGHCSACAKRKEAMLKFFKEDLLQKFEDEVNKLRAKGNAR